MAIREIIHLPDPVLRETSKPVERIDEDVLRLLDDMAETMYDAPGIGLAAIQIGIPLRLVTIDVSKRQDEEESDEDEENSESSGTEPAAKEEVEDHPRETIFMINPKILKFEDTPSTYEEGCLSIPDFFADVERPAGCTVSYLDRQGEEQIVDATGILSTCVQHELDHLDGLLFIDKLSRLKRDMVVRKFTKIAKQNGKLNSRHMVG
ncbi:MAG: peptide deformylase [Pseudomonadota bacterium]